MDGVEKEPVAGQMTSVPLAEDDMRICPDWYLSSISCSGEAGCLFFLGPGTSPVPGICEILAAYVASAALYEL